MGKNRLPFLQLVYKIVMDCQHDEDCGIRWSEDGTAVEIHKEKFRINTLSKYFKTKLLTSFSRNMNIHGFSKTSCEDIITYWHPDFQINKPPQVKIMKKEPYRGMKKHCKTVRSWEAGGESVVPSDPGPGKPPSLGYAKHYDSKSDGKIMGGKLSYKKRARQNKKNDEVNVKRAKNSDQGAFTDFPRYTGLPPSGKSDVRGFPYDAEMLNAHSLSGPGESSFHNKNPSSLYYPQQHSMHGTKPYVSAFDVKVGNGKSFTRPSLDRESMTNKQPYNNMIVHGQGQGPRRSVLKVETKKLLVPANFENTVEVSRDNSKTLLEQVLSSEILQWDNPSHFPPENDFLPSTPETMPMVNRVSSPISIFEAATTAMHYRS